MGRDYGPAGGQIVAVQSGLLTILDLRFSILDSRHPHRLLHALQRLLRLDACLRPTKVEHVRHIVRVQSKRVDALPLPRIAVDRFRNRKNLPIRIVESTCDGAGELDVLPLTVLREHVGGAEHQDIFHLRHGIADDSE